MDYQYKASVIIITYKQAAYIADAVLSVLMQETNFEYEVIIGNDCSPDNTEEVIQNIIATHPKGHIIKYYRHKKNVGMMPNFIFCLEKCKGKYVAICEGDDYWTDPKKLQTQVDVMEANPDVVLTYHDAYRVDANKNKLSDGMLPPERKRNFTADELKSGIWVLMQTMCARNVLHSYPKSFYKAYNGDTFYTSLLGNYGSGMYIDTIKPSAYRMHEGGMWSLEKEVIRKIKSIFTPAELMIFYKQQNDLKFYDYFKQKTLKSFANVFEHKIPTKLKLKLIILLIKYARYLGAKNTLHYFKRTILN